MINRSKNKKKYKYAFSLEQVYEFPFVINEKKT